MGPDIPRELRAFAEVGRHRMSTVAELLESARTDVEAGSVPACQIAVARDGEIVAFETFGDATDERDSRSSRRRSRSSRPPCGS